MPLDEEQKKLAAELKVDQGWSYSELGRLFSMSKGNVYKQVKPAVEERESEEVGKAKERSKVGTEERSEETRKEKSKRKRTSESSGASTESSWKGISSKRLLLIALWIVGILLVVVGIA